MDIKETRSKSENMSRTSSATETYRLSDHQAPTESKLPAPLTSTRKLRESCDACHVAKVKCIKQKSADCARCFSFGISCAYSPSARTGKPRGAKDRRNRMATVDDSNFPNGRRSLTCAETPTIQAPLHRNEVPPANAPHHHFAPTYEDTDPLALDPWGSGVTNAICQFLAEERQMNLFPSSLSTSTNSSPNSLPFAQPDFAQLAAAAAAAQQPYFPVDRNLRASTLSPTASHFSESMKHLDDSVMMNRMSTSPPERETCDCFASNLKSLETLRRYSDPYSSQNATPFDVALFISKQAITHCTEMLSCTYCTRTTSGDSNSTPMLIFAGLMNDILNSYSAACTAHFDLETTGSSPDSHSSSSSQLTLGTYLVDGEDGRHLKLEILMIELRKVERLWMQFKDVCAQVRVGDGRKSLLEALVCYLGQTLRDTVDRLEARRGHNGNSSNGRR
ncbi:MAG: hypothetical protein FRX48_09683 [Lasallia pustulata]|uniref:Zn(2)-C6 fungal-type domain-containing protein n=1 Tax=Lasallia pustulata TaxID=136370 RepID=A0A5M8PC52_9LECA|nr:MAG: hypothetical protein FRX48_09683 [Lasallia pustulata]